MPLTPPFTFNVDVKAESGKPFVATIVGVTDSAPGATMSLNPGDLSEAFNEVAKFPPPSAGGSSQSSRGGKSRKGKKSKGGKSRKARKSLRRK